MLTRGEVSQTVQSFGAYIGLTYGPAPADASITYTDDVGAPQTITDMSLAGSRLYRPGGWPSVQPNTDIVVTYTAGFTGTPADLDAAVLLLTGHWYAHREAVNVGNITSELALTVEALCRPYRAVLV